MKKIVKNQKGIALLMVLGVIAILTFLLAEFTFETKLNKIKVYNQQDKIQARLNAEAGLNFALGKLRLYQEGRNKIEKDENLKANFPSSDLESVIIEPFVFPLPAGSGLNIIQRTAIDEFMKKTMLKGELSVTFTKVTGFLNPNGLRISNKNTSGQNPTQPEPPANPDAKEGTKEKKDASLIIEDKLTETLQRLIKDKNDNDEDFHGHYSNLDAHYLVKELKYYVNDAGKYNGGEAGEIESKFNQKNLIAKHAPMTSIEELYYLPSWDDAIVDLIKDRLSIHEVSMIAVNEITVEDLKILFPNINNIQIEEFFKHRDGDPDKKIKPQKFKNAEDFKNLITGQLNVVTDSEYTDRVKELESAGLVIDTAGKMYKVNSRGVFNNSTYNLVAFVDLPIKPLPPKKPTTPPPLPNGSRPDPEDQAERDANKAQQQETPPPDGKATKAPPTELLKPRVVEIRVE